ncbi:MAG: hypothetical protein BGP10_14990 [Rhodanobacter sp. 68-29]|nr:YXWGXW repeat-containing protein [Rhodanobacter sp.]ODU72647.1 MAG: hypothetical protein ABT17_14785 [Rhodanobacter sp. SCN 69-32]OJY61230.1 MAG: hypothetical protein BGP10_14990 [Rhodanobacter sp. 68-29]
MQTRIISNGFSLRRLWLVRGAAALLAVAALAALPGRAHAGVFVSVNIAPPPLPVYVQPAIPGPGYIWTPGYWAWGGGDYYWVPGAWVLAPFVGALWTPGYWGWSSGVYIFHAGYWGRHVGFYGGINYGYGYGGYGYDGGYWRGGGFYYNRSVNRVTNNITNVYNRTVINHTTIVNRTSYNGGPRGIATRATPQQQAWGREHRVAPVAAQVQQRDMAGRMQSQRASVNRGTPPIGATSRAGAFDRNGAAPAPTAARETRMAPQNAGNPQRNGALRSAGFAPHANGAMQPGGNRNDGYRPAAANRGYTRPNTSEATGARAPNRYQPPANDGQRGAPYQPQGHQQQAYRPAPQSYPQQAYRPAPQARPQAQRYAQPAYRPAEARPAQAGHPAEQRGRAAPQGRRDDRQH